MTLKPMLKFSKYLYIATENYLSLKQKVGVWQAAANVSN